MTACSGTGQSEISIPTEVTVSPTNLTDVADVSFSIDQARFAFGPLYLCAAAQGNAELCEVAQAEMLTTTVLDALEVEPQLAGTLKGISGEVRSAAFDYGIHWFATDQRASKGPAATHGHSLEFVVTASRVSVPGSLRITGAIDLKPQQAGERAVATAPASGVLDESVRSLSVEFDIGRIIQEGMARMDWDNAFAEADDINIRACEAQPEEEPLGGAANGDSLDTSRCVAYTAILQAMQSVDGAPKIQLHR